MTALILIVDDLEPNVKLLEAKLTNEYYDVITASNGFEAIEQAKAHSPDIILLDVMMPEMDGFEACQKLKADPLTSHIPVVMVTALSEPSDRIRGLECGADDFITKPIKEIQLMARVKSLVRIKMLIDELRLRGQTSAEIGDLTGEDMESLMSISGCKVLVVDDDAIQGKNIIDRLHSEGLQAKLITEPDQTVEYALQEEADLFVVSTQLGSMDGLRLCSQLRSMDETRHIPELIIVDEDDERRLVKGLEMGVNDYLITPVDVNELMCRVRTNIRRKKYKDALKSNYKQSVNMAITDGLTGVYNRHYLTVHLEKQLKSALEKQKPLSFMIIDADHFKSVNDGYGHDVGDDVLKELATRMVNQTRGSDMVARFGGEEFVMLMPGLGMPTAIDVAERLRASVELIPFRVNHEVEQLDITVSVGVSTARPGDTAETILKRADNALYEAKHGGRNRVVIADDDAMISTSLQQETAHAPIESDERETEAAAPIVNVNALGEERSDPEDEIMARADNAQPENPFAQAPEIPAAPAPEAPAMPEPEVPAAPAPEAPAMPEPEVPAAPVPEAPAMPEPEVPAAPVPETPAMPEPEVPAAPVPEIPAMPEPEVKNQSDASGTDKEEEPASKPSLFGAFGKMLKSKKGSSKQPDERQLSLEPIAEEKPVTAAPVQSGSGRPPPENAKVVTVSAVPEDELPSVPGLELKKEMTAMPPPMQQPSSPISEPVSVVHEPTETVRDMAQHQPPSPIQQEDMPPPPMQPSAGMAPTVPETVQEDMPPKPQPANVVEIKTPTSLDHLSLGEPGQIIQGEKPSEDKS